MDFQTFVSWQGHSLPPLYFCYHYFPFRTTQLCLFVFLSIQLLLKRQRSFSPQWNVDGEHQCRLTCWIPVSGLPASACARGKLCFTSYLQSLNKGQGIGLGKPSHALLLAYSLGRISPLESEGRTLGTWFPSATPPFSSPDWLCCQYSIKNIDFFHACYLCPNFKEIPSTLFFLQHGKRPGQHHLPGSVAASSVQLWHPKGHIRPVPSWEKEVQNWVHTWVGISTFVYLLLSTGSSPICYWTAVQ